MLLEFSIENYLSFKDLTTLSMIGVRSFKEHEDTNTIEIDSNIKLLKSAVIYGSNASGKSNLISALAYMKALVQNSFRDALTDTNGNAKISVDKFQLNSANEKMPAFFEVVFLKDDTKYRYGFELNADCVESEWLFHTTSKEVPLFKRKNQSIEINRSAFREGLDLESKTRDNVLFLTLVAQFNGKITNQVIGWFKNLNYINGIHDRGYKRYTIDKIKVDKDFYKWAINFIKFLEISNITTTEEDVSEFDILKLKDKEKDEELINLMTSIQKIQEKQPRRDQILTWHRKYDENNLLVDTVPFNFDKQESEGTKKFLYLLGPWYDSLKNGKVLVVDELDSRLHSNITLKLIEYFHRNNRKNAQLIFAVHDISILNRNYFRRDQVWFVEKNQFGASELYSLADFKSEKVRKKSAFDKNYIQGKYGAVPYFNLDEEKLTDILYGEEEPV